MEPLSVVFFGISGSGKGTQCDLLEKYLTEHDTERAVVRPEMGSLLRTFMQSGTPLAAKTGEIVSAGGLVPSFMPIFMLTEMLNKTFSGTENLILDGTCRRPDQSRAVNDMMQLFDRTNLQVVVLTLTPASAKARLVARGRADDARDELIAARFSWYEEHVVPAINELGTLGWTVHEIDGEPEVETIHNNIVASLKLV